ncbi:MAG: DEAD/DEAH box helicase [Planctomycetota bacterium]
MTESVELLEAKIREAIVPGARGRLRERGLARGLVWDKGEVPPSAQGFSPSLTDDLLDYGHVVMAMALRLRNLARSNPVLPRAFLVAGETIESAVHRGDPGRDDRGLNRIAAAVSFHLGRYAARAFSVLPSMEENTNFSPTEIALGHLLRRSLVGMRHIFQEWLLSPRFTDEAIAARLQGEPDYGREDAHHEILTTIFMRSLALLDQALGNGDAAAAEAAREGLRESARTASALSSVSHWWTHTLASHLIDDLWDNTLHNRVPTLPTDSAGNSWNALRKSFIQRLYRKRKAVIDLWPSQIPAAARAIDESDNLVVALPTSAGKTRIAELCALRALASGRRVIYVTPLRALSSQVEQDLADTFGPLGIEVASLYGAAGIEAGDSETLRSNKLVVATPEKLDFAIRNDADIINDCGLVILDEGHMLGREEREVRYEAFVQRLTKREDAATRRLVCLSAMFPKPEEMSDLVEWIRLDVEGEPVHSTWRPTRQRFGTVTWQAKERFARLDVAVHDDSACVRSFILAGPPPAGSRRRRDFPADKNDLILAAAWRFVEQGKQVLVYCVQRSSVETLGRHVLKCVEHSVIRSLGCDHPDVASARRTGVEWLGREHPAVRCLDHGVALHHAGLPRQFLGEVEGLIKSGRCRVTVSSPTLAQGVNLPCSVLLVPSIWRGGKMISAKEFANVAGRAGRAFVDLEGLVIHIVHGKVRWSRRNWWNLVGDAKAAEIESGLLTLSRELLQRIASVSGRSLDEVLDYLRGNTAAWDYPDPSPSDLEVSKRGWLNDIASLDAALLGLLELETDIGELAAALREVLKGSLFGRQIARIDERLQEMIYQFLCLRAQRIWASTTVAQRRGYHLAGVGLSAGQFIDANAPELMGSLLAAETAIRARSFTAAADAIVAFAKIIGKVAPFESRGVPEDWPAMLQAWVEGNPSAEVVAIGGDEGVDFLQDGIVYRLAWAAEAVRVHALANDWEHSNAVTGVCAMAIETGSADPAVITLIRAGLKSRDTAFAAVHSTGVSFDDRPGMVEWIFAETPDPRFGEENWPTAAGREHWVRFVDSLGSGQRAYWNRATQRVTAEWLEIAPPAGSSVRLHRPPDDGNPLVLDGRFSRLGRLRGALDRPLEQVVEAVVVGEDELEVSYFGPPPPPSWLLEGQ